MMKDEQRQELKTLENNPKQLQEKLITWLKEKAITVEDLRALYQESGSFRNPCLMAYLHCLYENTETHESTEQAIDEAPPATIFPAQARHGQHLPGWFNLSALLDGFDINACDVLIKKIEIVDFELKALESPIIDAAINLVKQQLASEYEKTLPNETIEILKKKKEELMNHYQALSSKKEKLSKAYQTYKNITDHIMHRQYQTELHFFDPRRTTKKRSRQLAFALEKRRLNTYSSVKSLDITDTPARRLITAERSTIETSINILNLYEQANDHGYIDNIGWIPDPKNQRTFSTYSQPFTFDEKIQSGDSVVTYCQHTNPHVNHLGDFFCKDLKGYSDIVTKLHAITGTTPETIASEQEKTLARWMLDFCRHGKPLTLLTLQSMRPEATKDDVNTLNAIFYHCFIKEMARRMLPRDPEHQLPLVTAQIRALRLMAEGYVSIQEVFGEDAPYGVYTGFNIGQDTAKLREKIIRINILYDHVILARHTDNFTSYLQFFKAHPAGRVLPTRQELHRELKETLGGCESETDGEGYETDHEKEMLYQTMLNS